MYADQSAKSAHCNRNTVGSVDIHNKNFANNLGTDDIKTMKVMSKAEKQEVARPMSTPSNRSARGGSRSSANSQAAKNQDWLSDKSIKSVQEKADVETKSTRRMYNSLLETENTFVKDLEDKICHRDVMNQRKKELLHKKWIERVHEPIRKQINEEMKGPIYPELEKRKRELYKEYLEHTNKKGHVFLDTIAPDEYYPLSLHPVRPSLLTAETKALRDPLLSQEKERSSEDRLMIRCMTGSTYTDRDIAQIRLPPLPLVPLGRHGTECRTWLAMPLTDIESSTRLASRRRMRGEFNDCQVDFDTWAKMKFSPAIVDEEMQTQKKRMFAAYIPVYTKSTSGTEGMSLEMAMAS